MFNQPAKTKHSITTDFGLTSRKIMSGQDLMTGKQALDEGLPALEHKLAKRRGGISRLQPNEPSRADPLPHSG